jgi:hypothetical protein
MLRVSAPENTSVVISAPDGKVVLQHAANSDINIAHLPDGIYMIKVLSKEGVTLKTDKLVKKN